MKTEDIIIHTINENVTFIVGKNAQDNTSIILNATPDDIWFHVNNKSSCHVIALLSDLNIKIPRKNMKYIVKQGALLCKQHSYPSEKNLDIIYTKVKNIETTDIPGQVHTKECSNISI